MNEKWLEEAKSWITNLAIIGTHQTGENFKVAMKRVDTLNWLIEQAERVQELEKANEKNYWIASDFKYENLKLEQQNKRYRALLHDMYYSQNVSVDYYKRIIRKELEESK